jgi:hypothetical protein
MEVTVGLDDVEQRFKQLRALDGSVGAKVHAILSDAAVEINKLVESSPALLTIVQHLEQAAHLSVTSPVLQVPATDPTTAAPENTGAAQSGQTSSPGTTSTDSPSPSVEGSTS